MHRTIRPEGPVMPLSTFAFSLSQVILGHDLDVDGVAQCAVVFPKRFAGVWPRTPWTNWCCMGNFTLHVQFHVRYLLPSTAPVISALDATPNCSGLRLVRDGGYNLRFCTHQATGLFESRSSVAILTSIWHQFPHYSMVTFTDTPGFSTDCIDDQTTWATLGISPCDEFAGIAIFQLTVGRLITEWHKWWTLTLNYITSISQEKVRNFLSAWYERNL